MRNSGPVSVKGGQRKAAENCSRRQRRAGAKRTSGYFCMHTKAQTCRPVPSVAHECSRIHRSAYTRAPVHMKHSHAHTTLVHTQDRGPQEHLHQRPRLWKNGTTCSLWPWEQSLHEGSLQTLKFPQGGDGFYYHQASAVWAQGSIGHSHGPHYRFAHERGLLCPHKPCLSCHSLQSNDKMQGHSTYLPSTTVQKY